MTGTLSMRRDAAIGLGAGGAKVTQTALGGRVAARERTVAAAPSGSAPA